MSQVTDSKLFQWNAGTLDFSGACIVLVKTEWNASIADELEAGCREVLQQYQVKDIITITVPGAVEIPFAVKAYAASAVGGRVAAYVTLGCVIKGGTPHFDYVCQSVTAGVTQLNLQLPVPVVFGVLTVNNEEQAMERLGGVHGHKGKEAAITALKMIALQQQLSN